MADDASRKALPRRQLGRYLRKQRTAEGLTLAAVAKPMEWSISKLGRIERGEEGKIRKADVQQLCDILGFGEERTAVMVGLAQQADVKSWWHAFGDLIPDGFVMYVDLEWTADAMTIYRPDLMPGLLQTAAYARALDRIWFPHDSEEEQEGRIRVRMERQAVITRKTNPTKVDVVLHESVLHTIVGSPATMAGQLRHLADMSTKDNVGIRILPYSAGVPLGAPIGPFVILDFAPDDEGVTEPTVIYVENYTGDMYLERAADVAGYRRASATIQHAALDAVSSRTMLRTKAREYLS
ncbi:helix-turn-helix domain-containing protein [Nocardia sp. NBC_00565]|uniref:helix-turn-helix domain-containing protein n=1 Tax=Nocardia sp. NBC_00565 TaxID=2975993 RepID=UPI002E8028CE|nr:helix-turn-helix transcriptional regulator [Nocardia sp. NBC_00565]WUC01298.1 helix-turn-helix domain-containing protein [Nocardia sp. NBC_00565]